MKMTPGRSGGIEDGDLNRMVNQPSLHREASASSPRCCNRQPSPNLHNSSINAVER
jgi:hypothetical protein